MFLFLSRFYNLAVAFAVDAERSIDTIIYTLMTPLPENREPIGFRALPIEVGWMMAVACSVAWCRFRRRNAGQADYERGTPLCEIHQWG